MAAQAVITSGASLLDVDVKLLSMGYDSQSRQIHHFIYIYIPVYMNWLVHGAG